MDKEHRILRYFSYGHLPKPLQEVSKPFHDLAQEIVNRDTGKDIAEVTAGLRKLLEAKDCIVRANIK